MFLDDEIRQLRPALANRAAAPFLGVVAQALLSRAVDMGNLAIGPAEHQAISGLQQEKRLHGADPKEPARTDAGSST